MEATVSLRQAAKQSQLSYSFSKKPNPSEDDNDVQEVVLKKACTIFSFVVARMNTGTSIRLGDIAIGDEQYQSGHDDIPGRHNTRILIRSEPAFLLRSLLLDRRTFPVFFRFSTSAYEN